MHNCTWNETQTGGQSPAREGWVGEAEAPASNPNYRAWIRSPQRKELQLLWKGLCVWGNLGGMDKQSYFRKWPHSPYLCVGHYFSPAQRNLRESHLVSWSPCTPGRKLWSSRGQRRLRDFSKRPWLVSSCGHKFWVLPPIPPIPPGHQNPNFVQGQCAQFQGRNHNWFKPILSKWLL